MVATLPNDVFLPFAPDKPWLAPLAGWSDLPFRLLCRRFGAAVCCTEMISAKGLIYKSPGTAELFATCPEDGPVVVQLFGSEAPFMEAAAGQLRDKGFVWFDCNMGCSVPKVARTGSGAAMCKDIDNALAMAILRNGWRRQLAEGCPISLIPWMRYRHFWMIRWLSCSASMAF